MFTLVTSEDENDIHVAQYTFVSSQDCTHPPLKVLGSTADPEWQSLEIEATKGGDKSGQLLGIFMQWNLPKAAVRIQFAEHGCSSHLGQGFINRRQGVDFTQNTLIKNTLIKNTIIHTNTQRLGTTLNTAAAVFVYAQTCSPTVHHPQHYNSLAQLVVCILY